MPDIKVKNIYYMLSYAFQALREAGFDNVASEDFDSIHDLFAAILARGVGMQVKRGLYRDYVQKEEALAGHVLSSGVNCRCDSPRRDLWISLGRLMYPLLFRYVLRIRGTAER